MMSKYQLFLLILLFASALLLTFSCCITVPDYLISHSALCEKEFNHLSKGGSYNTGDLAVRRLRYAVIKAKLIESSKAKQLFMEVLDDETGNNPSVDTTKEP